MYFLTTTVSVSLLFFAIANALTITSPSAGDNIDPTQPITVQWTSSASDPSTFDLILDSTNSMSLVKNKKVASSISTSSGSYVLSTATLMSYGSGFIFKAQDSTGSVLATSGSFSLAVDGSAVSTSNGQVSFHSTYTATGAASNGGSATASGSGSGSSFYAQTTGTDRTATGSGTMTVAASGTTTGSSEATASNGFTTSTTSRSTSGTRSVASSAASATTSANAQPRLGGSSSQIAFSAAGIIAGLVALLA